MSVILLLFEFFHLKLDACIPHQENNRHHANRQHHDNHHDHHHHHDHGHDHHNHHHHNQHLLKNCCDDGIYRHLLPLWPLPGPISLAHATDEQMSATEEPIFDPADDDDGDDDGYELCMMMHARLCC